MASYEELKGQMESVQPTLDRFRMALIAEIAKLLDSAGIALGVPMGSHPRSPTARAANPTAGRKHE